MEFLIEILRRANPDEKPCRQTFSYEAESPSETVLSALAALNARENLRDADGNEATPIGFECGCLQKKCGACAMVINGKPALACAVRLGDLNGKISLEPLRKFPVVRDLIADRSIMRQNLKMMKIWLEDNASSSDFKTEYEASRCLQCGCCLEVCPNFYAGGEFTGMAGAMPMGRILSQDGSSVSSALYGKHIYAGCGKSLACREICPAKIDIDGVLAASNAIAVWNRRIKHSERRQKWKNQK